MTDKSRPDTPAAANIPAGVDRFEADEDVGFAPHLTAKLGIAIVSRESGDDVAACLETLAPQLELNDARVVIVDASASGKAADDIASLLEMTGAPGSGTSQAWKARAALVRARTCRTDSAALQVAISFLKAELYLFVHPSMRMRMGSVSALIDCAQDGEVAAAAPLITGGPMAGTAAAAFGDWPLSPRTELLAAAGAPFPTAAPTAEFASRVSLRCLAIRHDALAAVGGLDPDFGPPFDGADLTRRLAAAGFRIAYAPSAHVEIVDEPVSGVSDADRRAFRADRRRFHARRGGANLFAANIGWQLGRAFARIKNLSGRDDAHTHHPGMA